jgi:hypothetical protein
MCSIKRKYKTMERGNRLLKWFESNMEWIVALQQTLLWSNHKQKRHSGLCKGLHLFGSSQGFLQLVPLSICLQVHPWRKPFDVKHLEHLCLSTYVAMSKNVELNTLLIKLGPFYFIVDNTKVTMCLDSSKLGSSGCFPIKGSK